VRAYREGADTIRYLDRSVADLIHQNRLEDLKALPKIGEGIAGVIGEYVSTGKSGLLQDLEAQARPEATLIRVPGIGNDLARRIVDQIHVETLPELEAAVHDGRLETVKGFGPRRVEGVRAALAKAVSDRSLKAAGSNCAALTNEGNEPPLNRAATTRHGVP
jgi:DNA polymerase/3'-5' exonuclease PolX